MKKEDLQRFIKSVKPLLNTAVADPSTDYNFFSKLYALPNPDPILREMGQAEAVYRGILTDPHVAGEVRSIRGNFREHRRRIVVGEEGNAKAEAARLLCEQWMQSCPPNDVCDWEEVLWQMTCAIFTGYAVHEIVWDNIGNNILPTQVIDRPNRRFKFDVYGAPLLLSLGDGSSGLGKPVEPYQFVISRHSASAQNPYGMALLSSCFWAWTFKTGGWRYFVKYCERHGLPWPIAKYPQGTQDKEIDELAQAMEAMLENAYAVIPDGSAVELIEAKASGSALPQEALINLANREMSKALVGQSSVGENTTGVGSRASNETAFKRQEAINAADRDIANAGINQIFHWITLFNFGEGVPPPTMEFFKVSEAGKDRAETYEIAHRLGAKPSKKALLEELNIPEAKDADDELTTPAVPGAAPAAVPVAGATKPPVAAFASYKPAGLRFAQGLGLDDAAVAALAAQAANQIIDYTLFQPTLAMLAQYEADGKTLADFERDLGQLVGTDDGEALRTMTENAIKLSYLQGMATALETTIDKDVAP